MSQNAEEQPPSGVEERLARPGGITYLEIPAVDIESSAAFYEAVFGWSVRPGTPSFADGSGHVIGRWSTEREIARDPGVLPYIYVTSVDATLEKARARGCEVVRARYPEGNLWVATLRDPAGNLIGIWQAGQR
jgi:predicted enzyme related to lactoylglutathione lyase